MKRTLLTTLLLIAASVTAQTATAVPVQWTVGSGGNDHWYDFVNTSVDWHAARANALASNYSGMQGYLATITSAAESNFLVSQSFGLAWIGGSDEWNAIDETDEGIWKWMDGPEAGQVLAYTKWSGGEPNNCCGGEDYLQFAWGANGSWNDHGGPGNPGQLNGFIIEYNQTTPGPIPEPATLALLGLGLAGLGLARRRKGVGRVSAA